MLPETYEELLSTIDDARLAIRQTFGWLLAHPDIEGLPQPEFLATLLTDLTQAARKLREAGNPQFVA